MTGAVMRDLAIFDGVCRPPSRLVADIGGNRAGLDAQRRDFRCRLRGEVAAAAGCYLRAARPALQVTPSCTDIPPEQPMAPISLPSRTSGKPPSTAIASSREST